MEFLVIEDGVFVVFNKIRGGWFRVIKVLDLRNFYFYLINEIGILLVINN